MTHSWRRWSNICAVAGALTLYWDTRHPVDTSETYPFICMWELCILGQADSMPEGLRYELTPSDGVLHCRERADIRVLQAPPPPVVLSFSLTHGVIQCP